MSHNPDEGGFIPDNGENVSATKPKGERPGKPRLAQQDDVEARMDRIWREIAERGRRRGYREFRK